MQLPWLVLPDPCPGGASSQRKSPVLQSHHPSETEGKLPAHTLPCQQPAEGWERSSGSLCYSMRAGQGWGSGGTSHTRTRTLSPTCCVPPGLPRAVLQLSQSVAHANRPVLQYRWGQICLGCTFKPMPPREGTSANRLLPGWLPQPQCLHPWGAGSHRQSQPSLHQADCHHNKARTSRLVPVGEGIGEKPEEGWEMPWSLRHKHDRLNQALLLTSVKSHALVSWERQPRHLSTQQAAGPGNRTAQYNTPLPCQASSMARLGQR